MSSAFSKFKSVWRGAVAEFKAEYKEQKAQRWARRRSSQSENASDDADSILSNDESPHLYCQVCKKFALTRPGPRKHKAVFANVSDISASAKTGGTYCQVLEEAVQVAWLQPNWETNTSKTWRVPDNSVHLQRHWNTFSPPETAAFSIFVRRGDESQDIYFTIGRTVKSDTVYRGVYYMRFQGDTFDNDSHFAMMESWLDSCESSHPNCLEDPHAQLPKRVLNLGLDNTSIRLHVSGEEEKDNYAALSYCWGNAATVPRTTKQNLEQYTQCVPYEVLSKTFRDAVQVCRKLGMPCLWIDSLCIVQDDPDEWESEAARMGDIYGGAVLTIAPADSADSTSGLFYTRDSGRQIMLKTGDGNLYTRFFIEVDHNPLGLSLADVRQGHANQSSKHPLFKRKWCFQERMLSRRMLYFTKHQLTWECRTDCFHESDGPSDSALSDKVRFHQAVMAGQKLASGDELGPTGVATFPIRDRQGRTETPGYQLPDIYLKSVRDFTARQITYGADVLPAFSAFARTLSRSGLGDYYAGVWSFAMLLTLTWYCSARPRLSRHKPYNGPSWSWASLDGPVHYWVMDHLNDFAMSSYKMNARVVRIYTETTAADPFGRVRCAMLEIAAKSVQRQVVSVTCDTRRRDDSPWLAHDKFTFNVPAGGMTDGEGFIDTQEDLDELVGQILYIVRLGHVPIMKYFGIRANLLLCQNDDGTFRRVGIETGRGGKLPKSFSNAPRRLFRIV